MVSLNDVKIGTKLLAGFLIIVAILVVIAAIGYMNLQTLAMYEQKTMEGADNVVRVGEVNAALEKMRGDIYRYIYVEADRGAMKASIDTQIATVNEKIAEIRKTELSDKNKQLLADFDKAWAKMQTGYLAIEKFADEDDTEAIDRELAAGSETIAARTATLDACHNLIASNVEEMDAMAEAGNAAAASASMIMIIATIVGAIIAVVLGLFLTRSITGPLNKAINMLQELGSGHLGTRLRMNRKDEIGVMADTMDAFADDLKNIVDTMKKISAGDLSSELMAKDAQDEITPALKQTIEALRGLVSETNKLTHEATEGRLDTRGNAAKFSGGYKEIIEGINSTLDAVIGPLNVAAEYVDRISKGEIPQKIKDDYKGDFNEIKNNLNQCIDGLQGLVEANTVLQRMAVNDHSKGVEGNYQGLYAEIKTAVNLVRDRVNHIAGTIEKIGDGDMSDYEEYAKVGRRSEQDRIVPGFIKTLEALQGLTKEMNKLIQAAKEGQLSERGNADKFKGAYRDVVKGTNEMMDFIVNPVNETIRLNQSFATGDFTARFSDSLKVAGDFQRLKEALNNVGIQVAGAINVVNEQVVHLASSAEEANASIEEVSSGADQIAKNVSLVSQNSEKSNDGVRQVLKALEDLSSTVQDVAAKTEKVANLAQDANDLSQKGAILAGKADEGMTGITRNSLETGKLVNDIKSQMDEIGKIVDLITDLANQTNLLALNAAIEAARAGDAGRGFAVVATEVKSLAQESRTSAESIAEMIGALQTKSEQAAAAMTSAEVIVKEGSTALTETLDAFTKIVKAIEDISKNIMEVAGATEEQAASVEEITASANQMSTLVEETAKETVDAAAAAEEASAAIDQIAKVVGNLNTIVNGVSKEMSRFRTA